jgi:excisionase family DNA binding protein
VTANERKEATVETKLPSVGERTWITVPQLADHLAIPRTRAYELIQKGQLPAVRVGERSIRIHKAELEKFLLETRRVVAG